MASNRLQYFPFHAEDYLNDPAVMAMDADAEGCYIRLLARSWRTGTPGVVALGLVEEMGGLYRITDELAPPVDSDAFVGSDGPGLRRRIEVMEQLSRAFDTETEPGKWLQKRMISEYGKLSGVLEARRRGAEATNKWRSAHGNRDGERPVTDTVSDRSPTEEVKGKGERESEIETNTHTSPNGSASEFSLSSPPKREPPANKLRHRPPRGLDMPRTDKDWAETFAESFWPAYSEFKPGCSRAAAWKAWCAIPHPEGQSDWDAVWSAFEGYREKASPEPRFRKDASTWLNDYHRNLLLEPA